MSLIENPLSLVQSSFGVKMVVNGIEECFVELVVSLEVSDTRLETSPTILEASSMRLEISPMTPIVASTRSETSSMILDTSSASDMTIDCRRCSSGLGSVGSGNTDILVFETQRRIVQKTKVKTKIVNKNQAEGNK